VHHFLHDHYLTGQGLRNYWGYNSIGFFAPDAGYSAWGVEQVTSEFRYLVKTMHAAGIEVILDVVYNHTAEGNHLGPLLSFKGIDNPAYYRLAEDYRYYFDTTGTGNTLNMRHPHVLQLIIDSLRYWVTEMHVDGFRFDLAASLARQFHEVDRLSAFFDLIQVDPVVSQVKLIAEPWDLGEGGYQVGNFPTLWSEWNGRYRDTVRDYWRGTDRTLADFGYRLAGSSDLYGNAGRHPHASVNFITAHDGFTLTDLVSYDHKHNEANGEGNRDGTDDNRSWNCGVEGPTDDATVRTLRGRQQRALLTTLMLSFGVPLLLGGDELGRTQRGNNNAYCQDGELTWFDWGHVDEDLLAFTRTLIAFRLAHPVFRRRRFLSGIDRSLLRWFTPAGTVVTAEQWGDPGARGVAIHLEGQDAPDHAADGSPLLDDDFLVLVNAWWQPLEFVLPAICAGQQWVAQIDTFEPSAVTAHAKRHAGDRVAAGPRSIVVLRGTAEPGQAP
jgi:isoamylase